jgi:hypothetical protein
VPLLSQLGESCALILRHDFGGHRNLALGKANTRQKTGAGERCPPVYNLQIGCPGRDLAYRGEALKSTDGDIVHQRCEMICNAGADFSTYF